MIKKLNEYETIYKLVITLTLPLFRKPNLVKGFSPMPNNWTCAYAFWLQTCKKRSTFLGF